MKSIFNFILIVVFLGAVKAQNIKPIQKVYCGIGVDQFYSSKILTSKKILLVGRTDSHRGGGHQNKDGWVVMLSAQGDTLWSRAYGGDLRTDRFWDLAETSSGDLIFAGASGSFGGSENGYVVHTDSNGLIRDSYNYGDIGFDNIYDVELLSTEDRLFLGYSKPNNSIDSASQILIIKTDSCGTPIWMKKLRCPNEAIGSKLIVTKNKFYVLGRLKRENAYSIIFQCFDLDGNQILSKIYNGQAPKGDFPFDFSFTKQGSILVAGFSYYDNFKGLLVEIDTLGNILQSFQYQTAMDLEFFSLAIDTDSTIWLSGYNTKRAGNNEGSLVHLDKEFEVLNASSFWPQFKSVHYNSIQLFNDSLIMLVGSHSYWYGKGLGGYLTVCSKKNSLNQNESKITIQKVLYNMISTNYLFKEELIEGFERVNSLLLPVSINVVDVGE